MTSEERREGRYHRRQQKRLAKRMERSESLGDISQVFSFSRMYKHGKQCCNGVRWKQSTQNFERHLFSGTAKRRRQVLGGTWKPGKYVHFILHERGKVRPIDAPHITDRQVHKTLTKNVLAPLYLPSMIYDNGASMEGKGLHFAFERLKKQLRAYHRKHGRSGVMFLMDFRQFFPTAPHATIYERHRRWIFNDQIRNLADLVVASVPGGVGMPLGVEPSQLEIVSLPSSIDNHIKCQLGLKVAGHYMDDYNMAIPTREAAEQIACDLQQRADAMGLTVSKTKTQIIDLSKPFKFCKAKFRILESGRIIVHGNRDSAKRARRKLKAFKVKVDRGEMTRKELAEWMVSQVNYFKNYDDYGRIRGLEKLYQSLFEEGDHHV